MKLPSLSLKSLLFLLPLNGLAADAVPYQWESVNLQGMGYVHGLAVHPGAAPAIWARTDVGGIYRFDGEDDRWTNLTDGHPIGSDNVDAMAVNPLDPDQIFIAVGARRSGSYVGTGLWRSDDGGGSWQSSGLEEVAIDGNGPWRFLGERLAFDPNGGAEVLFYGSLQDGLWRSSDRGLTWEQLNGLPSGIDGGVSFVLADPTSGTPEQASTRLYAGVCGEGLFRSEDGGTSWSLVPGGPPDSLYPVCAAISPEGDLYVGYGQALMSGQKAVYHLAPSGDSLSNLPPPLLTGAAVCGIAIDPRDARHILLFPSNAGPQRFVARSIDGGRNWSYLTFEKGSQVANVTEPPYYPGWSSYTYAGDIEFDPQQSGGVWLSTGFGVYRTTNIDAPVPQWEAVMNNFEELVGLVVKAPPLAEGAELFVGSADMVGFRVENRSTIPQVTLRPGAFGMATGMAWCESQPQNMAWVGSDQNNRNGFGYFSSDNGRTWTPFASLPNGFAEGNVAICPNNPDNMVWANSKVNWSSPPSIQPHYTTDRGQTWHPCQGSFSTIENGASTKWSNSQFLVADRVDGGTFYMYEDRQADYVWKGSLYRSTDGGRTWTRVSESLPVSWQSKIESVPGKAGHIWYANRNDSGNGAGLYVSGNYGETFSALPGLDYCVEFGFGAPIPPSSEVTVFMYGSVGGVPGLYRSHDYGQSWRLLEKEINFGLIPVDAITDISGDMRYPGKVLMAMGGRGFFVGQALPLTDYQIWKQEQGISSDLSDLDGDGIPAIAEYYFGLRATAYDRVPYMSPHLSTGQFDLQMPGAPAVDDVSLQWMRSGNLSEWTTTALPVPVPAAGESLFIRARFSPQ
jgi:hypothetical protein